MFLSLHFELCKQQKYPAASKICPMISRFCVPGVRKGNAKHQMQDLQPQLMNMELERDVAVRERLVLRCSYK